MPHRSHLRWRFRVVPAFGALCALTVLSLLALTASTPGTPPDRPAVITGQPDGVPVPEALGAGTTPAAADALGVPADGPGMAVAALEKPDVAVWEGDEIIAYPKDPELRRAAREEVRARAAARQTRAPDVAYQPVRAGAISPVEVVPAEEAAMRLAARVTPRGPDGMEFNLSIPDDFEIPADIMRELSQSATVDPAVKSGMVSALAQSLIQDFHGIDQTTLTPPDCDIAVGPNHIVVVVNASYAVYDRCGTLVASGTLAGLTDASVFLFDPKVLYDEWNDRWIICFVARNSATQEAWIRLIVSSADSPPGVGGYWWYNYPWTNNGGWWGDYPDMGFDPDAVYITTNDFNWANPAIFQRARIAVLDKAEIYNAQASGRTEFFAMVNPGDATLAFALRATEMKSDPGEYYLVNSKSGGGAILSFWEITGAPAAPVLAGFNVPVGLYDNPPACQQPNGTYTDCGDARLLTARYYVSRLWAGHGQEIDWSGLGDPTLRSAVEVYIINTVTRTIADESGGFGAPELYYSYPAVDFDPLDRGIVCFAWGGPAQFVGTRYADFIEGGAFSGSGSLVAGLANYSEPNNAGTIGDPFRWGDYYGCDLDQSDNRTMWFHGQFASNSPIPSWDTWIGAASFESGPLMNVTPITSAVAPFGSRGVQGGPFSPPSIVYTVDNIGGSTLAWTLSNLDAWNSASATSGVLAPGASTNVTVTINATANGFAPGTYIDNYSFTNCMLGGATTRTTALDVDCPAAVADLVPAAPPDFFSSDATTERGAYVTALKDFQLCAIGFKADLNVPQTLTVRVYAATGTTRGALLASGSGSAVLPGNEIHHIPISYTLQECQEYDIVVEFGSNNGWEWWDDRPITPFDVDGVIRVRDGEWQGDAVNFALPYLSVRGSSTSCPETADLDPAQGTLTNNAPDDNQQRGVYIKAEETINLCSFGWYADLVAPQTLVARLYEATGVVRGALLAEGWLRVTSAGLQWHDVPIDYVLEEGEEYDLAITFGVTNSWPWWSELELTEPYTVGAIRVVDAESGGGAGNFALPHYRVNYAPQVSGEPFDLAGPWHDGVPPQTTSQDNIDYGVYVSALHDQELYTVGWMADVPEGAVIGARVYEATGTTRGALIAEGSVLSSGDGMRWHDVPVSASLVDGADYDIEIDITTVTEWRWWVDIQPPLPPYEAYSFLRIVDGEQGGNAENAALLHLRVNSCSADPTGIGDEPIRPPLFTLSVPVPNPVTSKAAIHFTLDRAGPMTMTVYDVAGRRVATLVNRENRPVGPGQVEFDSSRLASGVYFIKMETPGRSLSRKVVVVR